MPSGAIEVCGSRPRRRADLLGPVVGDRLAVEHDLPGARRQQPRQRAQQGRLAARVRADDDGERPVGDLRRRGPGDDPLVVGERDAVGRRGGRGSRVPSGTEVVGHGRGGRSACHGRRLIAAPACLADEQPDQVDAADDDGDDADGELGGQDVLARSGRRPSSSSAAGDGGRARGAGRRCASGGGRPAGRRARRTRSGRPRR